jgi:hypothetical protein
MATSQQKTVLAVAGTAAVLLGAYALYRRFSASPEEEEEEEEQEVVSKRSSNSSSEAKGWQFCVRRL